MAGRIVYSFDVFDTCFTRSCGSPASVFYLMAKRILGNDAHAPAIFEFVNARKRAERKALATAIPGEREDVTIYEVYDHFDLELEGYTRADLAKLEMDTESSVLRPIRNILNRINEIRSKGDRVIFISDTYLPLQFIREQLAKHGFFRDGDGLYVSNDVGLAKFSGNMFDHVQRAEAVPFAAIRHVGDNRYSDSDIPGAKGVQARWVHAGLTRYEQDWCDKAYADPHVFDIYLMAGISRSIRLSGHNMVHDAMVLDIIAPLFVPFVTWVLRDARDRGINKLYFLARDGYMLYEVARILSPNYPDIELHYLYGSRRAFYMSSVREASKAELTWIFPPVLNRTPRQMLKRVSGEASGLAAAMKQMGLDDAFIDTPLDAEGYDQFISLLAHPESRSYVLGLAEQQRQVVGAYFRQEGVYEGQCAIVDIGWSRFIQNVFRNGLVPTSVFAYYFSVFEERMSIRDAGDYLAAFYPEEFGFLDANKNWFIHEFLQIMEQFFMLSDQQSTIGFRFEGNEVVPVFEEGSPGAQKLDYFRRHVELIRKYAQEYLCFEQMITSPETQFRNCGYRSVTMLMEEPSREETAIFLGFETDNGIGDTVPLVRKVGLLEFMGHMFNREAFSRSVAWPEGTIVYSFGEPALRLIKRLRKLRGIYLKKKNA